MFLCTYNHVLHGTTKAVSNMQSSILKMIPQPVRKQILYSLDDFLVLEESDYGLITVIVFFQKLVADRNIKRCPAKCKLVCNSIRFCHSLITSSVIRFDPRWFDGLLNLEPPLTSSHLQQFFWPLKWVRTVIRQLLDMTAPFHEFMEKLYDKAGKRTARVVTQIQFSDIVWDEEQNAGFETCKNALTTFR